MALLFFNRFASNGHLPHLVTLEEPRAPAAEAYRTLRANLQFADPEGRIRSLVVTSAGPAEGKTTTAANLGVVLAQDGRRVLLVDADLRRPTLHRIFGIENHRGLTHAIGAGVPWRLLVQSLERQQGLDLIPCGPIPPNPSELLGGPRLRQLLEEAAGVYDLVLIDTPPVMAVADPLVVTRAADAVFLVARAGKTRIEAVKSAVGSLQKAEARLLGVVLNDVDPRLDGYGYSYYYTERDHGEDAAATRDG